MRLRTMVFGQEATAYITDYTALTGDADDVRVEVCLPEWSGRRTKAQALAGVAALRVLLAAVEAALTANDAVGEREGEAGE
jgi:hypothetical protein